LGRLRLVLSVLNKNDCGFSRFHQGTICNNAWRFNGSHFDLKEYTCERRLISIGIHKASRAERSQPREIVVLFEEENMGGGRGRVAWLKTNNQLYTFKAIHVDVEDTRSKIAGSSSAYLLCSIVAIQILHLVFLEFRAKRRGKRGSSYLISHVILHKSVHPFILMQPCGIGQFCAPQPR
jgi:hypothetical protein